MLQAQHHHAVTEEYSRLLYVALTRAEDMLFLCGTGMQYEDASCLSKHHWYHATQQLMIQQDAVEDAAINTQHTVWGAWHAQEGRVCHWGQAALRSPEPARNPPNMILI